MARQHAGMAVISEGHTEVVNMKKSRCSIKVLSRQRYSYSYSYSAEIRIRPNSVKPLFGTPLLKSITELTLQWFFGGFLAVFLGVCTQKTTGFWGFTYPKTCT